MRLHAELIGNLGQDAEVKDVNGQRLISFSVAHTEKWTGKDGQKNEKTTWVKCQIWRQPGKDKVAQYLTKGTTVFLEGTPSANAWTNKEGEAKAELNLKVSNLIFISNGNKKDNSAQTQSQEGPAQSGEGNKDDLPF